MAEAVKTRICLGLAGAKAARGDFAVDSSRLHSSWQYLRYLQRSMHWAVWWPSGCHAGFETGSARERQHRQPVLQLRLTSGGPVGRSQRARAAQHSPHGGRKKMILRRDRLVLKTYSGSPHRAAARRLAKFGCAGICIDVVPRSRECKHLRWHHLG